MTSARPPLPEDLEGDARAYYAAVEALLERRAPWPFRLDDEPADVWPGLGPVGLRLVDLGARAAGVAIVAGALALRAWHRARP